MLLAFTTVSAVLGKSTLRGMTALFIGIAMGLIGIDQISGAARYTGGIPEFFDGIEVVLIAVRPVCGGRSAVYGPVRGRSNAQLNTMGKVYMTGAGVAPFVAGLAARYGESVSVWHHTGGRLRDSDLRELCHRAQAVQVP